MKRCPITYDVIDDNECYSQRGLHQLSPQLHNLKPFALNAAEQRAEAIARMGKMSLQGVQLKISAQLKVKEEQFALVDQYGHYILKPQSEYFRELPENEALTMTLAAQIGIEVPVHGLVYAQDNTMTYFIKRFDRTGRKNRVATEDFAQLSGCSRETKYDSSMENVTRVISNYCTFPKIELAKLFKLTLFNFLIGNEDMHLKNFSLITRDRITTLSPAYDLLNSTIAMSGAREEFALPLNGKKNNIRKRDLIDYFAIQRLELNQAVIDSILQEIRQAVPGWNEFISISFLSDEMKKKYLTLLADRCRLII